MTKEQTVLEKTARTGQKIVVAIREVYAGSYTTVAYVDGKLFTPGGFRNLEQPIGDITHVIQSGKTGVGFTAIEAQIIEQAIVQAEAEYKTTPAGQMATLRQERQTFLLTIDAVDSKGKADFNRLHAQQDESCWQVRSEAEVKLRALLTGLSNWDRAHPEVLAQIETETNERTRRFLAQD